MLKKNLIKKLCQLPCFEDLKAADIKVINIGLSQPCFCVSYKNSNYFAKYLNLNSVEANVADLTAQHGISPVLVYTGHNWLITEFLVGEGLNTSLISEDEKLGVMFALLTRCHGIDYKQRNMQTHNRESLNTAKADKLLIDDQQTTKLNIPTLDIFTTIQHLLVNITCNDVMKSSLLSLISVLEKNLMMIVNTVKPIPVLCHGDANFSNAMQIKNSDKSVSTLYQLIDFECACIAPREYDFAMLLAVNEIARDKIPLVNQLEIQYHNSFIKAENQAEIVDNIAPITPSLGYTSIPMVTRYYDLSTLVNYLWYFSRFQSNKQENYKILARNQMSLLSASHSQANTILAEMR